MSDNKNFDELEADQTPDFNDPADSGDFDDFEGNEKKSIGDIWRNSSAVKIGAIVGGLILVVAAVMLFGGKSEPTAQSRVSTARNVSEAPGGDVSDAYANAVKEKNEENKEEALRNQGSVIPVPIGSQRERVILPENTSQTEDPLDRWKRMQEERSKREPAPAAQPNEAQADPNAEAINALAEAMSKQMTSILKTTESRKPQYALIMSDKDYATMIEEEEKAAAKTGGSDGNLTNPDGTVVDIIQPAGEIVFAQLITQANTDAPGPVLAQIMSGPLKGARLLGSFKAEEEYLVLSFDTVVLEGISYQADAVALDPKTANPGLITSINRRYFKRVVLPAAAAFIEGLGEAVADSGNDIYVSDGTIVGSRNDLDTREELYEGVEEAASKAGSILDAEAARTRPRLIVASGTPIGVLFIEPVVEDKSGQAARVVR